MSKGRLGDGPHPRSIIRGRSLLTHIIDAVPAELHRSNTTVTLLCGNLYFAANRRRSRLRAHGRSNGYVGLTDTWVSWYGVCSRFEGTGDYRLLLGITGCDSKMEDPFGTPNCPRNRQESVLHRLCSPNCQGRTNLREDPQSN